MPLIDEAKKLQDMRKSININDLDPYYTLADKLTPKMAKALIAVDDIAHPWNGEGVPEVIMGWNNAMHQIRIAIESASKGD